MKITEFIDVICMLNDLTANYLLSDWRDSSGV